MTRAAIVIIVLFLIAGGYLGWHSNRAYEAHGNIKVTKRGRLPGFRKARLRSGSIALVTVIIIVLALSALIR
jgi:hypothetical protein